MSELALDPSLLGVDTDTTLAIEQVEIPATQKGPETTLKEVAGVEWPDGRIGRLFMAFKLRRALEQGCKLPDGTVVRVFEPGRIPELYMLGGGFLPARQRTEESVRVLHGVAESIFGLDPSIERQIGATTLEKEAVINPTEA